MLTDSFKGTVEQGCPLCKWFGMSRSFPTHWNKHNVAERLVYHLRRAIRRGKRAFA